MNAISKMNVLAFSYFHLVDDSLVSLQLRPNFCDAWSNLASAYMRKGRLEEAAQCCRQALQLNPHLVGFNLDCINFLRDVLIVI